MKFGIREICDVVLRAKTDTTIGNKPFKAHEPVIYFDSLKTSSMEGSATTVYAQGGRGNSRLIAWEGERTVTFTMEDALISEMGLAVLTGAGLMDSATANGKSIKVHTTTRQAVSKDVDGTIIASNIKIDETIVAATEADIYALELDENDNVLKSSKATRAGNNQITYTPTSTNAVAVLYDLYVEKTTGFTQVDITPDKFGGNYYLEASTLFRAANGKDYPAEFIIPNCKVQSNFTFSMASSGDPSTFTFTMDAFPDYTKFDKTKKVLFAIQIIDEADGAPIVDVDTTTTV